MKNTLYTCYYDDSRHLFLQLKDDNELIKIFRPFIKNQDLSILADDGRHQYDNTLATLVISILTHPNHYSQHSIVLAHSDHKSMIACTNMHSSWVKEIKEDLQNSFDNLYNTVHVGVTKIFTDDSVSYQLEFFTDNDFPYSTYNHLEPVDFAAEEFMDTEMVKNLIGKETSSIDYVRGIFLGLPAGLALILLEVIEAEILQKHRNQDENQAENQDENQDQTSTEDDILRCPNSFSSFLDDMNKEEE